MKQLRRHSFQKTCTFCVFKGVYKIGNVLNEVLKPSPVFQQDRAGMLKHILYGAKANGTGRALGSDVSVIPSFTLVSITLDGVAKKKA
jgi:hypothetical protein